MISNIVLTVPPVLELATLCAAGTLSAPPAKVYCSQIVIGRLRVLVRKPAIPNQATRTSRGRPKPSRKAITQVPHLPPKASPRTGIAPWTSNRCSAATLTGITYADHQTHPRSHSETWEKYQRVGKVPLESEYEEFPGGRVIYDTKTKHFTVLADRCILSRKGLLARIESELHLPQGHKIWLR